MVDAVRWTRVWTCLKSPVEDDPFSRSFSARPVTNLRGVLIFLAELVDTHVSHYLMRCCAVGGA